MAIKFCEGDLVIHKKTKELGKIVPKNTPLKWSTEYMSITTSGAVWVSWGKDISSDAPQFSKAKLTPTSLLEIVKL